MAVRSKRLEEVMPSPELLAHYSGRIGERTARHACRQLSGVAVQPSWPPECNCLGVDSKDTDSKGSQACSRVPNRSLTEAMQATHVPRAGRLH